MLGMATYDEFAEWLRQEMQTRGWDQAKLARCSQTTTALISRMLSGERRPGAVVARRLARALHLAPEEIFRRAGLLPRTLPQPPGLEELVHLYGELTDEDRQRLIMIARSFRSLTHGSNTGIG